MHVGQVGHGDSRGCVRHTTGSRPATRTNQKESVTHTIPTPVVQPQPHGGSQSAQHMPARCKGMPLAGCLATDATHAGHQHKQSPSTSIQQSTSQPTEHWHLHQCGPSHKMQATPGCPNRQGWSTQAPPSIQHLRAGVCTQHGQCHRSGATPLVATRAARGQRMRPQQAHQHHWRHPPLR